jgi:hypothetical protein
LSSKLDVSFTLLHIRCASFFFRAKSHCSNAYFQAASSMKSNRRRTTDRRRETISWPNGRRVRPDRRLNNISVEWIPFNEVYSHPITRDAFCNIRKEGKQVGPLRERDRRQQAPSRQTQRDKQRSPIKSPGINIFKRTQPADVEQRAIHDRRTKNTKPLYDRRVRPDRRLSNFLVEWITFE